MKKLITVIVLSLAAFAARGQGLDFESFYEKYTGRDGYTTMNFTAPLLKMMTGETGGAFAGINSIKSVMTENPSADFIKDIDSLKAQKGFSPLFDVSSSEEGFQIWFREQGKKSGNEGTEYILYLYDDSDVVLVYVQGNIDLMDLRQLSTINFRKKKD